jgi:hypothetical protein
VARRDSHPEMSSLTVLLLLSTDFMQGTLGAPRPPEADQHAARPV